MTLPAELEASRTDRLPRGDEAGAPKPGADAPVRRRARALARRAARKLRREAAHVLREAANDPERDALLLHRLDEIEQQVAATRDRHIEEESLAVEVHANRVNLELMKSQVLSVVESLEALGMAIAPATGLEGAGVRMAELRERVNGLDRRLRTLAAGAQGAAAGPGAALGAAAGPGAAPESGPVPAPQPDGARRSAPQSALFDYVGFERRFRGDPAAVLAALEERYADRLAAHPPVVDIGCGRAEIVEMLVQRGVAAIGVDTDPSMVAEAQGRGLDVRLVDGSTFLEQQAPGSLGAIIATHVVEHLELDDLVHLLELAVSRLAPGGLFIAETPNPASLIVLGNSYILDPTHVRPLHPSLLAFLCEGAGFRDVRLEFYSPASDYHLPLIDDPDAPAWTGTVNQAFAKLNHVLFGPQEYAVIATAPEGSDSAGRNDAVGGG